MSWWPWMTKQVETQTSDSSGRSPGCCERCNGYGVILLNGHKFLCWEHYCQEMQAHRQTIA